MNKRLHRFVCFPVFLLLFFTAGAQQPGAVDSLQKALAAATNPPDKLYCYDNLSRTMMNVNPRKADSLGEQMILYAEENRDRNGIDTLKLIKKERPKLAVLMLSMHPENQYAIRALKAGASGYLTKQMAPAQLVTAIRQVKDGRKYVSPTLAEQLAARLDDDADRPPHDALSNREYQTLTLLASGKTLTEVAVDLKLSVKTVSVYRSRLLEKLQLKNNAELTHYAIKNGLVE